MNKLLRQLLIFAFLTPVCGNARTWTDKTGQQHIEAELVAINGEGKVLLSQGPGRNLELDPAELSAADRQYVREELARRREALQAELSDKPGTILYAPGRELCQLANRKIKESSGIACSRRRPGVFWTHNDSGDDARLYAFDLKGRDLGSFVVEGIRAYDWEDIASFTLDGKRCLLVGDVGNNGVAAAVHMLYLIEEPPVDPEKGVTVKTVPLLQTVHFAYEDDYRNCEAVGFDVTSKTVLLVSKEKRAQCYAYALPWPKDDPQKAFTARKIATLKLPTVTGMDVSPDGLRAVVLTYGNAYEYTRKADEDWAAAFSRRPAEIVLPPRIQGEAICFGPDGKTLYLTSEKLPTPLIEVPVKP
jgi:hypothetical protein